MRWCVACVVVAWSCWSVPTHADDAPSDITTINADPNRAHFGLMFRGAMRAQLGAVVPLVAEAENAGFALSLSPLIELHEPQSSTQVLPSQYWRARIALLPSYTWIDAVLRHRVTWGVEHESDHETAHEFSSPGFLTHNSLLLAWSAQWSSTPEALRVSWTAASRLFALSCTRDRERCSDFGGDVSAGAQLDVTIDVPAWKLGPLTPYLSAHGFVVAGHRRVRSESHATLQLGVWSASPALLFQSFLSAYLGNDVGITRAQRVAQLGIGLSLALR